MELDVGRIADELASRLRGLFPAAPGPNLEEIRGILRESMAPILAELKEPAGRPPDLEPLRREIERQHEALVAKVYTMLVAELAALRSPAGAELLEGRIRQMLDENVERIRQPIAALASALKEKSHSIDVDALAVQIAQRLQPSEATIIPEPAPPPDATSEARQAMLAEIEAVVKKNGDRIAKKLAGEIDSIGNKVQRLIDEDLETKLAWVLPGLVTEAAREGLDQAGLAEALSKSLSRSLGKQLRAIRNLPRLVSKAVGKSVRSLPSALRKGTAGSVSARLRRDLPRAVDRAVRRLTSEVLRKLERRKKKTTKGSRKGPPAAPPPSETR